MNKFQTIYRGFGFDSKHGIGKIKKVVLNCCSTELLLNFDKIIIGGEFDYFWTFDRFFHSNTPSCVDDRSPLVYLVLFLMVI